VGMGGPTGRHRQGSPRGPLLLQSLSIFPDRAHGRAGSGEKAFVRGGNGRFGPAPARSRHTFGTTGWVGPALPTAGISASDPVFFRGSGGVATAGVVGEIPPSPTPPRSPGSPRPSRPPRSRNG
jgi:hypothetical protein